VSDAKAEVGPFRRVVKEVVKALSKDEMICEVVKEEELLIVSSRSKKLDIMKRRRRRR
jgi:hypothetical protein